MKYGWPIIDQKKKKSLKFTEKEKTQIESILVNDCQTLIPMNFPLSTIPCGLSEALVKALEPVTQRVVIKSK